MRRLTLAACALALLYAPAASPAAGPRTGGTAAPSAGGGITYGQPLRKVRHVSRESSRPVVREFAVAPGRVDAGTPATFVYRVDAPGSRTVRVRIVLTRVGAKAPTVRLRLGYVGAGVRHRYVWAPGPGELPAAEYAVALRAFDTAGRRLRRTARASGRGRLSVQVAQPALPAGRFPVQGPYGFGGEDARFGAGRAGHTHQGQDIVAPEGTPLIAPLDSVVQWRAFQARGAGHYVVLRGADARDYVYMHLRAGSVTVEKGTPVAAGQAFAQVGSTGSASGPHLHFEIWPDGWYATKASQPIDPLPQLMAWAGTR